MTAIDQLLLDGLGWEDEQPLLDSGSNSGVYGAGIVYWFPTLMKDQLQEDVE